MEANLKDLYKVLLSAFDLEKYCRGWLLTAPTAMISAKSPEDLAPMVDKNTIAPTSAPTLNQRSVDATQEDMKGVILKISCKPVYVNFTKFISFILSPVPLVLEARSIASIFCRISPDLICRGILHWDDVNAVRGSSFQEGKPYATRAVSHGETSKGKDTFIIFTEDGIKLSVSNLKKEIGEPLTNASQLEALDKIRQIERRPIVARCSMPSKLLLGIFPNKKVNSETDRIIQLSEAGINISGKVDTHETSLTLSCQKPETGCTFEVKPTRSVTLALRMSGLCQLGKSINATTNITLVFYQGADLLYHLKMMAPLSKFSSIDLFLRLVPSSKRSAPLTIKTIASLPAKEDGEEEEDDDGDNGFLSKPTPSITPLDLTSFLNSGVVPSSSSTDAPKVAVPTPSPSSPPLPTPTPVPPPTQEPSVLPPTTTSYIPPIDLTQEDNEEEVAEGAGSDADDGPDVMDGVKFE